ncbi:hypothetical protein GCM10010082_08970 [Kushneria pakistanensis]|uniref:Uncharacterized protein n=1 Tax=Kushneria pakistanensis TaxID=1508770 RepID=A0ABQ3FDC3_9GAMM|nr:hypothetical protein GCM10010082_08970 [Kushneria pakistanensis]
MSSQAENRTGRWNRPSKARPQVQGTLPGRQYVATMKGPEGETFWQIQEARSESLLEAWSKPDARGTKTVRNDITVGEGQ